MPMKRKLLKAVLVLALSGCTSVTAEMADGTRVNVVTFAQSRQDIDIGKSDEGLWWRASNSSPDQTLAQALLNLSNMLIKAPAP